MLRSANLWNVIREGRRGDEVINYVMSELGSEASVIYIKLRREDLECRILINVKESKAFTSCVRDGEELCGSEALEFIREVFRESYIMYIK